MPINKNTFLTLPPSKFIWLGIIFSIVFWFVDSLIDTVFFSHEPYLASLQPTGMELYMRLLVCSLIIVFGYLTSRYVETNNHLNRYIALGLKEDSNRYKIIFETAPILIMILNQDLMILEWNAEAERTFGWKTHEAMGRNFYELLLPEHEHPENPSFENLLQGADVITHNLTKSGNIVACSWRQTRISDGDSRLTSVMLIGQLFDDGQGSG